MTGTVALTFKHLRPYLLFVLIALFVWIAVLARQGSMSGFEHDIFVWIYDMPEKLRGFALLVTQLGSPWVLLGVVGLLLVVRRNPRAAVAVFRNSVIVYALVLAAKVIVGRPRPVGLLEDISSREFLSYGQGFPSAHTALATVIGLTLWTYLPPRWRWVPVAWIGLVAWSRIYLGVHVPSDVLGGFLLGIIVVLGAQYFSKHK